MPQFHPDRPESPERYERQSEPLNLSGSVYVDGFFMFRFFLHLVLIIYITINKDDLLTVTRSV